MALFGKIFGSGNSQTEPNLAQILRDLERRSKEAHFGAGWTHLNRAGDLCLKAGDTVKAVQYFGQAIDALLEDGQPEPARGVAKKIIRVHPKAIRTLCTLTWLDLVARQPASAVLSLRSYADASRGDEKEALTAEQVFTMARLTPNEAFLTEAAEVLSDLGYATYAAQVREWLAERGSPDAKVDPDRLAFLHLNAAIGSNALRKAEGSPA